MRAFNRAPKSHSIVLLAQLVNEPRGKSSATMAFGLDVHKIAVSIRLDWIKCPVSICNQTNRRLLQRMAPASSGIMNRTWSASTTMWKSVRMSLNFRRALWSSPGKIQFTHSFIHHSFASEKNRNCISLHSFAFRLVPMKVLIWFCIFHFFFSFSIKSYITHTHVEHAEDAAKWIRNESVTITAFYWRQFGVLLRRSRTTFEHVF